MLGFSYRRGYPTPASRSVGERAWAGYLPINNRPVIRWPNDARLALWICPNILNYELNPPHDQWINPWSRMPHPDVLAFGRQDYGPRVGFWRMLDVLDKHDVRCTAVVNSTALREFPEICDAAVTRRWDFVGHGEYNTRFIYGLSQAEELAYHKRMMADVEALTGVRMAGAGGPGPQAATENTPDLLAAAGYKYYTDFYFDDQPFPLNVKSGRLISLPYTLETNDSSFLASAFEAEQFAETVKRQFDVLYREGAKSGRVMCISLHAYLFGQPHRTRYLDEALSYIFSFPGVWNATGAEIADYYLENFYQDVVDALGAKRR